MANIEESAVVQQGRPPIRFIVSAVDESNGLKKTPTYPPVDGYVSRGNPPTRSVPHDQPEIEIVRIPFPGLNDVDDRGLPHNARHQECSLGQTLSIPLIDSPDIDNPSVNQHTVSLLHSQIPADPTRSIGRNSVHHAENRDYEPWSVSESDPLHQLTVRSVASIGLGSSDGKKIRLRSVHTTGCDGLTLNADPALSPIHLTGKLDGSATDISEVSSSDDEEYNTERRLPNRLDFLLACIGLATGLGNLWRFPYVAYRSGGGAFLVPYTIMVWVAGLPLVVLELALGQYMRYGPLQAFRKACPLLAGTGYAMALLCFILSSYYSVAMTWAVYFLGSSFSAVLPWTTCNNTWNTNMCQDLVTSYSASKLQALDDDNDDGLGKNSTFLYANFSVNQVETWNVSHVTPTQQFFDLRVLDWSGNTNTLDSIKWELLGCLTVAWVVLYLALWRSVRWCGKTIYITATFPFLLLVAFLARALTLEGADDGLRYFFRPDWSLLLTTKVWLQAASQSFNSLGIGYGFLTTFASYTRFHGAIVKNAVILTLLAATVSMVTGIIGFATLGHIAVMQNIPLPAAVSDGPGWVFIVFPQIVAAMPFPHIWAALFFIMIFCVGIDTQLATVEVVISTLNEIVPRAFRRRLGKELVVIAVCLCSLAGAIPYVTKNGVFWLQWVDTYVATIALLLIVIVEVFTIGVIYGANRINRNIREMTDHSVSIYFRFCWSFLLPVALSCILGFSLFNAEAPYYRKLPTKYEYPHWALTMGWALVGIILAPIPINAVYTLRKAKGSFWERVISSSRSKIIECPCCHRAIKYCLKETQSEVQFNLSAVHRETNFAFTKIALAPLVSDNSERLAESTT